MIIQIKSILTFLLFLSLFSCKKVIEVNLKSAAIKTVITGEVNNLPGPHKVTVSTSAPFSADNNFPPMSGAFVTIAGNGIVDTLLEEEPGNYFTQKLEGQEGESYTLKVSIDGTTYTSTSTMPQRVRLDSLTFLLGNRNHIYPVANFQDPAGVHNYYQFVEYVNGKRFSNGRGLSLFDDRFSDGRYITNALYDDSSDIKEGVVLKVEMKCIDEHVFTYFNELLQNSGYGGGFSSPAPDNPESNISGGALGYFSANTVSSKIEEIQ